jgi:cell division FtsZ-interacting protein ZapD
MLCVRSLLGPVPKIAQSYDVNLFMVANHVKRFNIPTHYCCEVELNYLHIYVHSHHQKEHLIKSCILFLFGRVC